MKAFLLLPLLLACAPELPSGQQPGRVAAKPSPSPTVTEEQAARRAALQDELNDLNRQEDLAPRITALQARVAELEAQVPLPDRDAVEQQLAGQVAVRSAAEEARALELEQLSARISSQEQLVRALEYETREAQQANLDTDRLRDLQARLPTEVSRLQQMRGQHSSLRTQLDTERSLRDVGKQWQLEFLQESSQLAHNQALVAAQAELERLQAEQQGRQQRRARIEGTLKRP